MPADARGASGRPARTGSSGTSEPDRIDLARRERRCRSAPSVLASHATQTSGEPSAAAPAPVAQRSRRSSRRTIPHGDEVEPARGRRARARGRRGRTTRCRRRCPGCGSSSRGCASRRSRSTGITHSVAASTSAGVTPGPREVAREHEGDLALGARLDELARRSASRRRPRSASRSVRKPKSGWCTSSMRLHGLAGDADLLADDALAVGEAALEQAPRDAVGVVDRDAGLALGERRDGVRARGAPRRARRRGASTSALGVHRRALAEEVDARAG